MKSSIPDYIKNPSLAITITVIGAGGTGSLFLQQLARIVYAYRALYNRECVVVVCDGDRVSESNIGRQGFSPNEVGANKAYSIVSKINRFYGFDWLASCNYFDYKKRNDITLREYGANFIISAVDSKACRKQIKRLFQDSYKLNETPEYKAHFWMDLGNTKTTGNVVVASPELGWPDVIDEYGSFMKSKAKGSSCSLAMALNEQDLFINPTVATIGAKWLWECLTKSEMDWRGAFINLDTLAVRKLKTNHNAK